MKITTAFFSFWTETFLYQCINHKNYQQFNSFLRVNSFKLSCQLGARVGNPFGGKVRIIPFHNTPWRQPKIRITLGQLASPSTCCGQVSAFIIQLCQHVLRKSHSLAGGYLWKSVQDVLWSAGEQKTLHHWICAAALSAESFAWLTKSGVMWAMKTQKVVKQLFSTHVSVWGFLVQVTCITKNVKPF